MTAVCDLLVFGLFAVPMLLGGALIAVGTWQLRHGRYLGVLPTTVVWAVAAAGLWAGSRGGGHAEANAVLSVATSAMALVMLALAALGAAVKGRAALAASGRFPR